MSDPSITFPDQPRVELDRRIADLVDAANDVLAAQGRLRALLRANHAVTAQLDLDAVLRTIVDSARSLTGADAAVLRVGDGSGGVEQVVREPADGTGAPAVGDAADGRSLVVPVRVGGADYADLELLCGPGGFSDEDEQLVRSLAATAGYALEHALLYRETQRREEFAAASAAVTAALLGEQGDEALSLVADRMRSLLAADSVFVALLDEEHLLLKVVAVQGEDPNSRRYTDVPVQGSLLERVLQDRVAVRFDEPALRRLSIPATDPYGPVMTLPLDTAHQLLGAIVVSRVPDGRPFSESEFEVARDFVGRTSIALELHGAREDQGRMRLFEDRGRIARDLHDRVIQQLFATGMQLQGVLGTLPEGRNAERVDAAITTLDASIAQIRRIIFTLSGSGSDGTGRGPTSRHRLLDLVSGLTASLGVEPTITFTGPVDSVLDGDLVEDVLAVVSEGVTNAVKHGGATVVSVQVAATPEGVRATVTSDGRPLPEAALTGTGRRSGLANLEERAERRGGTMRVDTVDERAVLDWRAPRPAR